MSMDITDRGPVVTSAAENIEIVEERWQEAFGPELNLAPDTPQGQLIASEAAILTDKDSVFLQFINQINPATASGVMQDALGAIYFLSRTGETPTYVQLECMGLEGTYINGKNDAAGGAIAKSASGDKFICSVGGTIPASGVITLQFESEDTGPVPAPANSITQIYRAIPGWDACNNPTAGVIGQDVESRADFEARRRQSVAKNATGSVPAIYANVANVDGVLDCRVYENINWEPKTIGAVTMDPKSIYVVVVGGDDNAIAQQIYNRKSATAGMNGNTVVYLYDAPSGAQYEIRFDRPTVVRLRVRVTALQSTAPAGAEALIRQAVYDNFYGLMDGTERVHIGDPVYASRFYCSISALGISAINIDVAARDSGEWGNVVTCEINEIFNLDLTDIEVILQ